jgi:hypothetical protein
VSVGETHNQVCPAHTGSTLEIRVDQTFPVIRDLGVVLLGAGFV